MSLKNFRAIDFKANGDNDMKMVKSKKDKRMDAPVETTTPIIASDAGPEDVPSGTVSEILTWVGDNPVRAQKALDTEVEASKPRKGLVDSLQELIDLEVEDSSTESK